MLAFFFFVIGKEQDTVYRFSVIPLSVCLVLGLIALDRLVPSLRPLLTRYPANQWWFRAASLGALVLMATLHASIPVARTSAAAEFVDPHRVARFLQQELEPTEKVLIAAGTSQHHPGQVAPLPYQRVVAQTHLPRERLISTSGLGPAEQILPFARQGNVRFVVVFEGGPGTALERVLLRGTEGEPDWLTPVLRLESARVYRVERWPVSGRPDPPQQSPGNRTPLAGPSLQEGRSRE